jgi:RNase adaptor protein for sRNA GlmZ degradation
MIVEIVGVAGSGKTTTLSMLSQQNLDILPVLHLRSFKNFLLYVSATYSMLPILLRQIICQKSFDLQKLHLMIRLQSLYSISRRLSDRSVMVLDQGPIFTLMLLADLDFEDDITVDFTVKSWWNQMLSNWSHMLDMIIFLDAPDEVLINRIRTRDKWHPVKSKSDVAIKCYLLNHRTLFEAIVSQLLAIDDLCLVSYDTHDHSLPFLIDDILSRFSTYKDNSFIRSS